MKCPSCDTEQKSNVNFCNKCGFNLANYRENELPQVKSKEYKTLKIILGLTLLVIVAIAVFNKNIYNTHTSNGKLTLNSNQVGYMEDL